MKESPPGAVLAFFRSGRRPGAAPASRAALLTLALFGLPSFSPAQDIDQSASPEARSAASYEPGLSERAVPILPDEPTPSNGYVPLYRLTRPYYNDVQAVPQLPPFLPPPDPSSFRSVVGYAPPVGLLPERFKTPNFVLRPWVGFSQNYDSNINLSPHGAVSDFYSTPRAGFELQYGTPDSVYVANYETLVAVHADYEAYEDLFYDHPEFDAFNQKLDLTTRIGRADAIWRPYLNASDVTGSDLLTRDLTNRTERYTLSTGVQSQYNVTNVTGVNHVLGYYNLQHPDQTYNNVNVWRSRQEVTFQSLQAARTLVWTEYRTSQPDRGNNSASEVMAGFGWAGKFDPRLYSELHLGWDELDVAGAQPGRKTMNPIRFDGYTTFDWSDRFRLTLRYDRNYVFNEQGFNDNYLATLIQVRGELYLGGDYYATSYFGVETDEFETSHNLNLNWRPEIEIARTFPNQLRPLDSRVFFKVGYEHASSLNDKGDPISSVRVSIGTTLRF